MITDDQLALLERLRTPSPDFNVPLFVRQCRSQLPLTTLSEIMMQYGNQLQQDLVQLLNTDFEQYISLSTSLQGTEQLVENILHPINEVQRRLNSALTITSAESDAVQKLLKQKKELDEKRMQVISKLPLEFDQLPPGKCAGGIERRARIAARIGSVDSDLADSMKQQLEYLINAESPPPHEIACLLRAFSASGFTEIAYAHCRDLLRSHLTACGEHENLAVFLTNVQLLFLAQRCSLFDQNGSTKFAFLKNCFFPALVDVLVPNPESKTLFTVGQPATFHSNFTALMTFIEYLDTLRPDFSLTSEVVAFVNRFNLDVYFRVRFNFFVTRLESILQQPLSKVSKPPAKLFPSVSLEVSATVAEVALSCFHADVFITKLAPNFFSISVQMLARFSAFLSNIPESGIDSGMCLILATDVKVLSLWVKSELADFCIKAVLRENCGNLEARDIITSTFGTNADKFLEHHEILILTAVKNIVQLAVLALDAVPRIKATYGRSGQPTPTIPLLYVQQLVQPLEHGLKDVASDAARADLGRRALSEIAAAYRNACFELLDVMRQTEQSLRRLGSTSGSHIIADSSGKIATQLRLDVQEFQRLLTLASGDSDWDIETSIAFILKAIDDPATPKPD
uniref:Conserved oligomeric Golgi complex subunit 2 n=1 Tax=Spongospora subterranea TaxID=70186 RepID=A0A0H5R9D2_9EUKA|eukprot:CRZ10386.1 hypothetical protein [Spongospora subterranea]